MVKTGFAVFIAALAVVVCAVNLSFSSQLASLRTEAIERGYALHCPEDGRFAWVGECGG